MTYLKPLILLFVLISSSGVLAEKKTEFSDWQLIEMSSKELGNSCILANIPALDALTPNERLKALKQGSENNGFSFLPSLSFIRFIDINVEGVIVLSTLLWVEDGITYKTSYNFDNKKRLSISAGADEKEFGNIGIHYNYEKYTKVMLKYFKKYNEVSIIIDGVDLRPISLKGFSKAFKKFEECSRNSNTLNKVDPFD